MTIKTKDDWWKLAEQTLPEIPDYAAEFGIDWPHEEADNFFKEKDHLNLHIFFETIWAKLPDNEYIRFHPFYAICDLCSEYWVFQEN